MEVDWDGIYPAITTKFKEEDDSLDLKMFEHNINAQLDAGIHGIVLGGSLGEASTLKKNEKFTLLEKTLELVGDQISVVLNIAQTSTRGAVQEAEEAEEKGAHGLMVLPPMQYKADDRETVSYFKTVAESTSLPIMIYNNPVDYSIETTPNMFEKLLEHENIQAVKESTRDLTNITRYRNRFGDRLKILCGVDTLALESLLLGADGWVAGLVAAFPRETVAIYELARAGRLEEAREIYRWFMPLLELDINPKLVQNIKLAEVTTGLGTETVRPPRLPLAGEEREQVLKVIHTSLENRPELPRLSSQKTGSL
ncbi:dihydrodipicolinate synthase family protein [Halalkalibaculum sp. DA3122]|uniref:dihydrodipicolinate synthase family protein n=1 Tax=Halalkalibaculum sp. DA3122 TaxID=3373607 RepID=UPI003754A51A